MMFSSFQLLLCFKLPVIACVWEIGLIGWEVGMFEQVYLVEPYLRYKSITTLSVPGLKIFRKTRYSSHIIANE